MTKFETSGNDARVRRMRIVIFALFTSWMIMGPFYRQVLGGQNKMFRQWTMFSAIGLNLIDARFYQEHEDGSLQVLDRFSLLSGKEHDLSSRALWRIVGVRELRRVEDAICGALPPPKILKTKARIATRHGWFQLPETEQNQCLQHRGWKD